MATRRRYRVGISIGSALLLLVMAQSASADDETPGKLLNDVVAVYTAMQTLTADFAVHQEVPGVPAMEITGTLKAKKPNLFAIDASGALPARMTSDGNSVLFFVKPQNAYAQI